MSANLEERVAIELSKGELLVIFEFLTRSFDDWHETGNEDMTSFVLAKPDDGERTALWRLEGSIERNLVEIFAADYHDMIQRAKAALTAE